MSPTYLEVGPSYEHDSQRGETKTECLMNEDCERDGQQECDGLEECDGWKHCLERLI